MEFSSDLFLRNVPHSVRERADEYMEQVKVVDKGMGIVKAKVRGSHVYDTSILNDNGKFVDRCSCPYGATCKHTIALAYVIEENERLKSLIEMNSLPLLHSYRNAITNRTNNTIDLIKTTILSQETPTENSSKYRLYYVLREIKSPSWGDGGKNCLAIEVGRAEKKDQGQLILKETQNARATSVGNAQYLTKYDKKILSIVGNLQSSGYDYHHYHSVILDEFSVEEVLKYLAQMPLVFWEEGNRDQKLLKINNLPADFKLRLKKQEDSNWQFVPEISVKGEVLNEGVQEIFDYDPPIILTDKLNLFQAENSFEAEVISKIMAGDSMPNKTMSNPSTKMALWQASEILPLELPAEWEETLSTEKPIPRLILQTGKWEDKVRLTFGYETVAKQINSSSKYFINENSGRVTKRDVEFEAEAMKTWGEIMKRSGDNEGNWFLENEEYVGFWDKFLPLIPIDWEIYIDEDVTKKVSRQKVEIDFETKSSIDWLDISGDFKIDEKMYKLHDLMEAIMGQSPLVRIKDQYCVIPKSIMDQLKQLEPLMQGGGVRLHRTQIGLLEGLKGIVNEDKVSDSWQKTIRALRDFKGIKEVKLPKSLTVKLRPYQHHGVSFLQFLNETGFGGILADDMGLGKTVQAIASLTMSYGDKQQNKNSLVVCPTSVVQNWQTEIKRFSPKLNIYLHIGKDRALPAKDEAKIIITNYAILRRDKEKLLKQKFNYVILDEAQYIKNGNSQTNKVAKSLTADHRLSLTGTPIENNLTELYSQYSFLNPGMLGSLADFKSKFAKKIERDNDVETRDYLKKLIAPFFLRRTKENVLKELPPKIEQIIYCEMATDQRDLYMAIKAYYQAKLLKLVDTQGIAKSQIQILEALLRLRQVCCDPQLLKLEKRELPKELKKFATSRDSTKRDEVIRVIKEALAGGHSIVLFSQFVQMLEILQKGCKTEKIPTQILTGQTKNRQELIDKFQKSDKPIVFLISLKAGGTGINLTAASYVIHYDPWWNPAVEMQATDRTHRIGQTKTVNVYKFLVKDSVEEKILELQKKKRGLIDDMITATVGQKRLSKEDLAFLLG